MHMHLEYVNSLKVYTQFIFVPHIKIFLIDINMFLNLEDKL